jgi:general secretion pathway protein G
MDEKHNKPARIVLEYESIRSKRRWWQSRYLPLWLAVLAVASGYAFVIERRLEAKSRPARALATISTLEKALDRFELNTGRYPTSDEGLEALVTQPKDVEGWQGPYINAVPLDPWGNPFIYLWPGEGGGSGPDLLSTGPDGKPGTADDIMNWQF